MADRGTGEWFLVRGDLAFWSQGRPTRKGVLKGAYYRAASEGRGRGCFSSGRQNTDRLSYGTVPTQQTHVGLRGWLSNRLARPENLQCVWARWRRSHP